MEKKKVRDSVVVTTEDGTIHVKLIGNPNDKPDVDALVDKVFAIRNLSEFDKKVFLSVCILRKEKERLGFPKVVVPGIERPLPLEEPDDRIGGMPPCEISYLEL